MKKVLIVDDTAFMRLAIKTLLEKNNFNVVGEAENGIVAIRRYKEMEPDMVIMDITMPKMDGIEAVKEIIKYDKNAVIIMISATGQEIMVREAILAGAKTFIVKPYKEDYVLKTLSRF